MSKILAGGKVETFSELYVDFESVYATALRKISG